jgi:hypothetical protein
MASIEKLGNANVAAGMKGWLSFAGAGTPSFLYQILKKPHALYCHLRPLWLHQIFRHYLVIGTIFGKSYWT